MTTDMMTTRRISMSTALTVAMTAAMTAAACGRGDRPPVTDSAGGEVATTATAAPSTALQPGAVRFTVASTGNTARYRVREQLMGRDLPNDAIGETQQVSGTIVLDRNGAVVPAESKIVVATGMLKSDSDRRDGYVRRRLLQTDSFPSVELMPTAVRGLPKTLPKAGATSEPVTFDLVGNLTVRGVTQPTTWRVTARQTGTTVTGTAATRFTFSQFRIDPPRVPVVLSVADTIGLEYDFTFTRDGK